MDDHTDNTGWPRISGPLGSAAGFAAGIVATLVAVLAGAGTRPEIGLFLLALAVAGVSAITTVTGALATSMQCWLLYDGFVVGRSGSLVLDDAALETGGLFAIIALAATGIAGGGATAHARLTR